uniref:uncharacterized protein LOC109952390 n=1 Tax=Monopterus albus TaxID=43700 RepID=UPI0009B41DD7|nr:uncharacterized protein LOC109952390 [Monopterus albus]
MFTAVSKVQRISSPAYDYDSVGLPVRVASRAPVNHRFLLKTKNQSLPLCFDVRGDSRLKLLHLPNSELLVSGKLNTVTEGFERIVIRFKFDKYVAITADEIIAQGLRRTRHTGQDPILLGSMTVIRRGNEINVTAEGTHLIILVHEKNSKQFLWPLLREQPSDNNAEGILAVKPAVYEEIQHPSSTKLKIKDQEIDVSRSSAADYTSLPPLVENCWLMSPGSAL